MSKKLTWILGAVALVALVLVIVLFAVPRAEPAVEEPVVEDPAVEEPVVEEPEVEEPEEPEVVEFRQSPFLDGRGLSPVAERLPRVPKIANELPEEHLEKEVGTYGGTLRLVTMNIDWDADLFVAMNEPLVNSPGVRGEEFTPNILYSVEVSPDYTQFTLTLREGLRWSDGEIVTTDDVRFAVENVLKNTYLTPTFPNWLRTGANPSGAPGAFEYLDDYTFRITFDKPYGGFFTVLSVDGWRGYTDLIKPEHYLKRYHVDFTPLEDLEPMIAEEGFELGEWHRLFALRDIINWELGNRLAVGFPVLYPWKMVEAVEGVKTVFERNPYYFKVDEAGNQLPYVDRIESHLVEDMEMVLMRILGGEVDFNREDATMLNMALYRENEQRGGFTTLLPEMHKTPTDIHLNLSNPDPIWRQVVQDVRFRRALSLALDREEIIDTIYFGLAEPGIIQDSTFDLDEANRLLDEIGMTVGNDGYRIGPDGERFTIPFEIAEHAPDMVPLSELIVEMWKEIGIHVDLRVIDSTLWGTRTDANEIYATIMWTGIAVASPFVHWDLNRFGPAWHLWHSSGGTQGEEPPTEVKEFYRLLSEIFVVPIGQQEEVWNQMKQSLRENIFFIIHSERVRQPLIVNQRLGNVTDKGMAIAVNFSAEQLFFRD